MNKFVKVDENGLVFDKKRLIYSLSSLGVAVPAIISLTTGIFVVEIIDTCVLLGLLVTDATTKFGFINNSVRARKVVAIETQKQQEIKSVQKTVEEKNNEYFLIRREINQSKALSSGLAKEIFKVLAYAFPFVNKIEELSAEDSYTLESLIKEYIPGAFHDYENLTKSQQKPNSAASKVFLNQIVLLQQAVKDIHYNVDQEKMNALKARNQFIMDKFSPDLMKRDYDFIPDAVNKPEEDVSYDESYWTNLVKVFDNAYLDYAAKNIPSAKKQEKNDSIKEYHDTAIYQWTVKTRNSLYEKNWEEWKAWSDEEEKLKLNVKLLSKTENEREKTQKRVNEKMRLIQLEQEKRASEKKVISTEQERIRAHIKSQAMKREAVRRSIEKFRETEARKKYALDDLEQKKNAKYEKGLNEQGRFYYLNQNGEIVYPGDNKS